MIFTTPAQSEGDFWVTTIDGNIYVTPVPEDCPGCAIEFVKTHTQDRWTELRTDRIFRGKFE